MPDQGQGLCSSSLDPPQEPRHYLTFASIIGFSIMLCFLRRSSPMSSKKKLQFSLIKSTF